MKVKCLLMSVSLIFLSISGSYAQFPVKKGTKLLELTAETNGSNTKSSGNSSSVKLVSSDIVLKLGAGYFIKENLAAGIMLIPVFRKSQVSFNQEGSATGFTAGIFGRRYLPLSENFALSLQALLEGGYNNAKVESPGLNLDTRTSFLKVSGVVGASYYFSPRFGVLTDFDVAGLQYLAIKVGKDDKPSGNLNLSVISKVPAISLRFSYLF